MFGTIRNKLGLISVVQTPTYIHINGVNTYLLFKDMYNHWGSGTVAKYMFSVVRSNEVKMRHFFGLDFLYVCQTLYDTPGVRTPRRTLAKIIAELKEHTWLGDVDRDTSSITDLRRVENFIPFTWKPFQTDFIKTFGKMVPTYRLKGYMLDAGAGTGKTLTNLGLAEALDVDHCIVVVPKNSLHTVWEDTIKDILIKKKTYWTSDMSRLPTLDDHYYICHYEALEPLFEFVKSNPKKLGKVYMALDESHNFNRIASQRTQTLIEMSRLPQITWVNWASGTPLLALGTECIPFLKCVDPLFDDESEMRFCKIFGRDAKRANDILRNRMGYLKYHVPKQDVVDGTPIVTRINVTIPNGMDYSLATISERISTFVVGRKLHYEKEMPRYKADYTKGLEWFIAKYVKNDSQKSELRKYQAAFKTISSGYDARNMVAEVAICTAYENKIIIPLLPNDMKVEFRKARSVVKYPTLVVVGEALGGILGKARTQCNVDIVKAFDMAPYIDESKKKTLIFTSYVEVVDEVARKLGDEYDVAKVYGATNKDLASIVSKFYKDPDLNPLVATFQSLSTAVPLTAANTIIMLNQPFRSGVRTQTIARAHRLGQDEQTYVFDVFLDTGEVPNVSTRSNDIMEWSAAQVASILGVTNVDLDTLTLEARTSLGKGMVDELYSLDLLEMESAEVIAEDTPLPPYLYHGSMYQQSTLKPGFQHSGILTSWDGGGEDNTWLYASANRDTAIMLGIASAIEKTYQLDHYQLDESTRKMHITSPSAELTVEAIHSLEVYLYTIAADKEDEWMLNFNPQNNISDEYKTQSIIDGNLSRCVAINVAGVLSGMSIVIKRTVV